MFQDEHGDTDWIKVDVAVRLTAGYRKAPPHPTI